MGMLLEVAVVNVLVGLYARTETEVDSAKDVTAGCVKFVFAKTTGDGKEMAPFNAGLTFPVVVSDTGEVVPALYIKIWVAL